MDTASSGFLTPALWKFCRNGPNLENPRQPFATDLAHPPMRNGKHSEEFASLCRARSLKAQAKPPKIGRLPNVSARSSAPSKRDCGHIARHSPEMPPQLPAATRMVGSRTQ